MISPLMIISLDQGKLYAEKPKSGAEEDLAFAAERSSRPAEQVSSFFLQKLFALPLPTLWHALKSRNQESQRLAARQP